ATGTSAGGTTRGLRGTTRRITRSEIATHRGRRASPLLIGSAGSGARPTGRRGITTHRVTERALLRVGRRTTGTTHTASTARTARTTRAASTTGRASGSDSARATVSPLPAASPGRPAPVTPLGAARVPGRPRRPVPAVAARLGSIGRRRSTQRRGDGDVATRSAHRPVRRVRDAWTAAPRCVHHRRGRPAPAPPPRSVPGPPSFYSLPPPFLFPLLFPLFLP